MRLSALIITKNEETLIADCITSVSFCDEIIVLDSESTDSTIDVAQKLGARVIRKKFTNYADQRTAVLKHAKGDWVLYVDADERVSKELRKEIQSITNQESGIRKYAAYKIPRQNYYLGNYKWPKIEYLERLFL
ncbi:MAG: glycosyltransferase family 2 protein, partial [Candidatus Roizmanbacteria bacterium]|nr:glycosyltransferase family 2 protein [Candidatus Roizmanbacteria bacterium]